MIGCDIVLISRIARLKNKAAFVKKILNKNELILLKNDNSLAGLFAAKEAVAKALGCGIGKECSFKDIELFKDEKGAPKLRLNQKIIKKYKIKGSALSIAHDGGFAIAVAVFSK